MALTPYTRQEEWYQQMINASTGNYLPSITAQDEGKVLTVENDGSWGVENVPQELPAVETTDKDKYLHTNDSTGAVEWADAPTELPSVSGTDEGKVLTVNNSGVWVAANPSGGGRFVVTFSYDPETEGWSTDKTFAECVAAWEAGKTLFAFADMTYIPLTGVYAEGGTTATYISFGYVDAETFTAYEYEIDAEGVYYYENIPK